jgi:TetR/AcrR family transcriptional regulator of autoinduction and epiphytic fitness
VSGERARAVDPRIERSRRAVLDAALQELGAVGYGAFAIESVAARSGVAKSTIYRHWKDKLALIGDAFETFHEQQAPDIATGTARERLERVVRHVAEIAGASVFSDCIPALVDGAERDPRLRRFHHRFQFEARRPLVALISQAVAAGELPAHVDADVAASALLGVIFYRRLMSSAPFDPQQAESLVAGLFGPRLATT